MPAAERHLVVGLLAGLDVEAHLRAAGLDERDAETLRRRLVGEPPPRTPQAGASATAASGVATRKLKDSSR